jgi:hypothetical protein
VARADEAGQITTASTQASLPDVTPDTVQNPATDENLGPVGIARNLEIRAEKLAERVGNFFNPKDNDDAQYQNPATDENLGPVGPIRNVQLTVSNALRSVWNGIKGIFGEGTNDGKPVTRDQSESSTTTPSAQGNNLDIRDVQDIKHVYVSFGLNVGCPDLQGVSGNGYIYTVQMNGNGDTIERAGCGLGTPQVYATEIAQDLERNFDFAKIDLDVLFTKMSFKFLSGQ